MFENLYIILGSIEILMLFIFIGKYIYFEKYFQSMKAWYIYFGVFIFSELIICFVNKEEEIKLLMPFLFFSFLVFLSRRKHKIKGIFLILPITGILFSIIALPVFFLYLFKNSMAAIVNTATSWMWIFDVLFWIGFVIYRKKKKAQNERIINNRTLSKWERNLINTSGLFLLVNSVLLIGMDNFKMVSPYSRVFIISGIFVIIVLVVSIIGLVIQGNGKSYYQQVATLNEYYLGAQLKHFKAYQEAQRETRRVYHDMKNHMACLHHLIIEEKKEEAVSYINKLSEQVQQIDKEIYTGNNIVDAILNEKYVSAKEEGISFLIHGKLGKVAIDAIDLCTIFSNAIDNSLEALKASLVMQKEVQIQFTQQKEMQFLMFRNQIGQRKVTTSVTKNKDSLYHGFGLENIRMAVEKYHGHMKYYIEKVGEQEYFVLEIILFMQLTTR